MKKDEVIDLLTENVLNERLAMIVENDEELKVAKLHSMNLFNKLLAILSEEQKELFDWCVIANAEEQARTEYLVYKQGLKDMANLGESLYNRTDREEAKKLVELSASDNK